MYTFDERAVVVGSSILGVSMYLCVLANVPLPVYALPPILTGVVVGFASRNFEDEYVDAFLAGVLGPILAWVLMVGVDLVRYALVPSAIAALQLAFVFGYGFFYVVFFAPFLVAVVTVIATGVTLNARAFYVQMH